MGPRIIDIDILLIENYTSNTNLLQVPHIALPFRKFALIPLADIAATVLHPILKITIAELLTKCKDDLDVQKI
ncbi:MAG TPA: 2-amino-4-hydroxy-6-hydroxymethyldihydropteridine diphosphokinase [Chitinophagaceae bacterium]|nr:2-amino-4-hydroxy-6-hydroxymethyldihydropteridine diphosphokinase [Chitinophagaceae bacterium]